MAENTNSAAENVIKLVEQQHAWLRTMMDQVAKAGEAQRQAAFGTLSRFLDAHEAAEAHYLEKHELGTDQSERWTERLREVNKSTEEFAQAFAKFQQDLLHHTETEIKYTIPKALQQMTAAQIELVQSAFERVRDTADPVDEQK